MFTTSRVAVLASFVSLAAALAACSSAEDASDSSALSADTAVSMCASTCQAAAGCDHDVDEPSCEEHCISTSGDTFSRLRSDVASSYDTCMAAADCRDVLSTSAATECMGEATAGIAASDAARGFCAALASAVETCGGGELSTGSCIADVAVFSDASIARANRCASLACDKIDDCLSAAIPEAFGASSGGGDAGVGDDAGYAYDAGY